MEKKWGDGGREESETQMCLGCPSEKSMDTLSVSSNYLVYIKALSYRHPCISDAQLEFDDSAKYLTTVLNLLTKSFFCNNARILQNPSELIRFGLDFNNFCYFGGYLFLCVFF